MNLWLHLLVHSLVFQTSFYLTSKMNPSYKAYLIIKKRNYNARY